MIKVIGVSESMLIGHLKLLEVRIWRAQFASPCGRLNAVVAASRISSDSAGSSTARERITAPMSPAIIAKACFRRAATDWAGMKRPSASIKYWKPFVTARRTPRG